MSPLTKKQKQVLDFVQAYVDKNGYSHTLEEIKRHFKLSALSTVHQHIETLVQKGYLNKNSYQKIELKEKINELVQVPLLGTIAAGEPIEEFENKETIAIPKDKLPKQGNIFALKVRGDSMIDENINNGDIVLIKQQSTAENGQKVVALIDEHETTLKTFYKENGHIRLQPANQEMSPIIVDKKTPFAIQGVIFNVVTELGANQNVSHRNQKNYQRSKLPINEIVCGDCVEILKKFPNNSIDIVVTSPPYDGVRMYNGFSYNLHNTGKELLRVLKDGGIVAMVIQDQTKNFGKSLTSFKTIVDWVDNIGFKLFETVIYKKHGAEGAWWSKRFRVDHEYIPLFLKGDRPAYFNKENLKIPSKHGGKTLTGCATRLTNGQTLSSKKVLINPLKCRGTIWDYTTCGDGSRLKHQHPATFPDKIPYDIIQCFCPENGIVLDPFIGSGTTALAAIKLNHDYIGIDISKEYCDLSKKRIQKEGKLN